MDIKNLNDFILELDLSKLELEQETKNILTTLQSYQLENKIDVRIDCSKEELYEQYNKNTWSVSAGGMSELNSYIVDFETIVKIVYNSFLDNEETEYVIFIDEV